jgi:hypothetical protein
LAIFGRFLGFGGKRFLRENGPEMTGLEGISEVGKIGEKTANGAKLPAP